MTNVVNALAQSLIDAMRDDDEDKKYWERFRAAFTGISGDEETPWEKAWNAIMEGNVGSNMNPLGQIPFVKDALSIMQGYDVSRTEMEIVSDLIQAGQTAIQSADGQGKRTRVYALKGLLAAGAKMFGIPASNLTRDMWGLAGARRWRPATSRSSMRWKRLSTTSPTPATRTAITPFCTGRWSRATWTPTSTSGTT